MGVYVPVSVSDAFERCCASASVLLRGVTPGGGVNFTSFLPPPPRFLLEPLLQLLLILSPPFAGENEGGVS